MDTGHLLRDSYEVERARTRIPTPSALQVFLFGPGELWHRGDITRRARTEPKAFALLIRLALCRGTDFVRRDALLALLWPDLDGSRGRNALSQAMHRLRRDLGTRAVVTRGREEIGLSEHVWCDVRHFHDAVRHGRLPAALALYRGSLLEGFHLSNAGPFHHWLDMERRETQHSALRSALALADREEAAGRSREASGWLRRAVEISPADDVTLRRLIRGLQRIGDRAGAIRAYESAAARLWVELELEPDHETRGLVEAMRKAPSSSNPASHRAFLRGRYMTGLPGRTAAALASFERAIALDPAHAQAHAGIAESLALLVLQGHVSRQHAAGPLEAAARRAIELDARLSDPHIALGVGKFVFSRDWAGAEAAFRQAVQLDPWSSRAHGHLSFFLSNMGWLDEGVAESTRAVDLDPLDPLANFLHGFALYRARRHEESLARLHDLVELLPEHALAHLFIAENELRLGRLHAAIPAARAAALLQPDDPLLLGIGACVLGFAGEKDDAQAMLRRLRESAARRYVNPHFMAAAHAGLGELDQAFSRWQSMIDGGEPGAFLLRTDPLFDPVRSDPRFSSLLERLDLPEVPVPDRPFQAG